MNRFKVTYLPGAIKFLEGIEIKAARKLVFNISKSQAVNDSRIFKKLKNSNIWEFKTEYNAKAYRLFAFWDKREDTFVVCTHGILKKTQKTLQKEIEKADKIRKQYLGL